MEITIKRYSRKMTYEDAATLDEFWELAKCTERSLEREQRRHWDGRECDEYIVAAQGVLPYCATPEELVCQQETLDEILAVLALCTKTQREQFLLYALHDYSYAEIGRLCGCSKAAVHDNIEGVRKKFFKFFRWSTQRSPRRNGYQVKGNRPITGRDKLLWRLVPPMPRRSQ